MLQQIQHCFLQRQVIYTQHARIEMENEAFGEIREHEVVECVEDGKIIEEYPSDDPYPSCLIYGRTQTKRPLHVVCAYSEEDHLTIIITVYQPDPEKWEEYTRRKL